MGVHFSISISKGWILNKTLKWLEIKYWSLWEVYVWRVERVFSSGNASNLLNSDLISSYNKRILPLTMHWFKKARRLYLSRAYSQLTLRLNARSRIIQIMNHDQEEYKFPEIPLQTIHFSNQLSLYPAKPHIDRGTGLKVDLPKRTRIPIILTFNLFSKSYDSYWSFTWEHEVWV